MGEREGCVEGSQTGGPQGRGKRGLCAEESAISLVIRRAQKLCKENAEGSGTDRGLYSRTCIARFLSHFACGSVNYETVEMLGNACI